MADRPLDEAPWSVPARRALLEQVRIAIECAQPRIEPEHMLVALAELKTGCSREILRKAGVRSADLRSHLGLLPTNPGRVPAGAVGPHASERWREWHGLLEKKGLPSITSGDVLHSLMLYFEKSSPASTALTYLKKHKLSAERVEAYAHMVEELFNEESIISLKGKKHIAFNGVVLALTHETRWSRSYRSKDQMLEYKESKFADGGAVITPEELEFEWPRWGEAERRDFCSNVSWADKKVLPALLRIVMRAGSHKDWSCCASAIAKDLPLQEAVTFLSRACRDCPTGQSVNLCQALTMTNAPGASSVMRECLAKAWQHPQFMSAEGWNNRIAFDAICSLKNLLILGTSPEELREKYEVLKRHPHEHVRATTVDYLGKYYA